MELLGFLIIHYVFLLHFCGIIKLCKQLINQLCEVQLKDDFIEDYLYVHCTLIDQMHVQMKSNTMEKKNKTDENNTMNGNMYTYCTVNHEWLDNEMMIILWHYIHIYNGSIFAISYGTRN